MFSLLHDSWNAFPTFAIIDHTMTVRAKPWTLSSNSNTNSCDGNSNTINGFSGGNTSNFIQQLVDECGSLCEPCSGTIDILGCIFANSLEVSSPNTSACPFVDFN